MADEMTVGVNPEDLSGEKLERRYIRVRDAANLLWVQNPKLHDIGAVIEMIVEHGFRDPSKFDKNLENVGGGMGAIVAGNGRIEALYRMEHTGIQPPRGILLDKEGVWYMPVDFGVDARDALQAKAFAIDHNNAVMMGGRFTALEMGDLYDPQHYLTVMEELAEAGRFPVSADKDDYALLQEQYDELTRSLIGKNKDYHTPDEAKSVYENANIKQIVLFFPTEQYLEVLARLKAVLEREAVSTNTDAFLKLLEAYERVHSSPAD